MRIPMTAVNIDIVSDVMCPWCYIGKKRLEEALKDLPENLMDSLNLKYVWLDPDWDKDAQ